MGIIPVPTAEGCDKMSLLTKICYTKHTLTKNNLMASQEFINHWQHYIVCVYIYIYIYIYISCC